MKIYNHLIADRLSRNVYLGQLSDAIIYNALNNCRFAKSYKICIFFQHFGYFAKW